VSIDEPTLLPPKLTGAPAYVRPPTAMPEPDRPFDPDELPLEVHQTDEERELASTLSAHAYTGGATGRDGQGRAGSSGSGLHGRSFSLRAVAGRLLRGG
jgi:hypothetical protein